MVPSRLLRPPGYTYSFEGKTDAATKNYRRASLIRRHAGAVGKKKRLRFFIFAVGYHGIPLTNLVEVSVARMR